METALGFQLGHACEQHAGIGHQIATRLHPQLIVGISGLDLVQHAVEFGDVQRHLTRMRRHAEPPTDIEYADAANTFGQARQLRVDLAPMAGIQHARTKVRMQAQHGDAMRLRQLQKRRQLIQRQAKFAAVAARAHLFMMTQPTPKIHAQHDLAIAKQLAPMLKRMQRVQRDGGACTKRQRIVRTRREIRCEQQRYRRGHCRRDGLQFTGRHTLERETCARQRPQDRRVRIGLQRIVPAINRLQRLQFRGTLEHGRQVIDVARRGGCRQLQQVLARVPAPPCWRQRRPVAGAVQRLPARAEQRAVIGA